jgi:hypothetical protein
MCCIDLANAGLSGRAEEDRFGQDERQFLTALRGIALSGRTPADEKLALFTAAGAKASTRSSPNSRIKREPGPHASRRHCEERSDEAIQARLDRHGRWRALAMTTGGSSVTPLLWWRVPWLRDAVRRR